MQRSLAELETIVRDKICRVCSDRSPEGQCGLEEPQSCALFQLFPQVAQAIHGTHSNEIGDYIQAIRDQVCSRCAQQAADGSCTARREVRCALDAYLLLIVEVIEEATGKKMRLRQSDATGGSRC